MLLRRGFHRQTNHILKICGEDIDQISEGLCAALPEALGVRHCKVPYPLDTYAVSVQCFSVDVEVMISALMLSLFEPAPEREIDPL